MTAISVLDKNMNTKNSSKSGIYCIRNSVNGKRYVGSAVNIGTRFTLHKSRLSRGVHHSIKLQNAWNKYGADSFAFEILEIIEDREQLYVAEQKWIDKYDASESNGYNILKYAAGGRRGMKNTPEHRQRLIEANTGRVVSDETRKKLSEAQLGKKASLEVRAKMSAGCMGRKVSDKTKEKIRIANLGKKMSAESIAKTAEKQRGIKRSAEFCENVRARQTGRKMSEETKRRMSAARMGRVVSAETRKKISDAQIGKSRQSYKEARQ